MNKVIINNIRIYSGHGVLEQEKSVGAYYTVDVEIKTDFHAAMKNDELDGTIDYSEVYKIICDEMSVPSKLIENVSYRIISKMIIFIDCWRCKKNCKKKKENSIK
jgi:dihydroneopterin aldolase